ncbi:MAG: hypothetical protein LKJ50_10485 [Clostridiales bacterium]|nr:hypothetical protein [Clostridiales bacterium]MCI2160784.1 hypothetical protein [Oscillospiraceae bacterium]MCI1962380.1 hypothetical protein [Clostridiales bacterium]MCI2022808.1 hypothetical protein [Clostridiales bacterium]MCI2027205.1 hypothetical protein [Clostridiales bacterium]
MKNKKACLPIRGPVSEDVKGICRTEKSGRRIFESLKKQTKFAILCAECGCRTPILEENGKLCLSLYS